MAGKSRVVYVVSNTSQSLGFKWTAERLDRNQTDLSFILLNPTDSDLETDLRQSGCRVHRVSYHGYRSLPRVVLRLFVFFLMRRPDVVHCHMIDACIAGLSAAWILRIRRRVYTRHHATYHHEHSRKGVLLDHWLTVMATDVVAISANVRQIMVEREAVDPEKISLVHHGFDLDAFCTPVSEHIEQLRQRYNIAGPGPVIGVIARFVWWKGIQYIIPAFKELLQHYPNAKLVLANALGVDAIKIRALLQEIPQQNVVEIPFERDLFALYPLFDVYVHVPVDPWVEAFGMTYVEALAAGVPAVFTRSGIAREFIKHDHNAVVVDFKDSDAIFHAMTRLLTDRKFCQKIIDNGRHDVRRFTLEQMMSGLESLYQKKSQRT